jgi:hypothetical protein
MINRKKITTTAVKKRTPRTPKKSEKLDVHDSIDENEVDTPVLSNIKSRIRFKKKHITLIAIIIIVLLIISFFIYPKFTGNTKVYTSDEAGQKAAQEAELKEIEDIVNKINRHFILPEGEVPTMATVADAESLKAEQPFYTNVVDGDKVLIYVQNKQAIIYSPSRDIIVNIGPIVVDDQDQ